MILKKLTTKCGNELSWRLYAKGIEKTKCSFLSSAKTTIEGVKAISSKFRSISLPLIRAFPELIAMNVIGVQAMTSPVGLAYASRFRFQNEMDLYNELV